MASFFSDEKALASEDVRLCIFRFLTSAELRCVMLTSAEWRRTADSDAIWVSVAALSSVDVSNHVGSKRCFFFASLANNRSGVERTGRAVKRLLRDQQTAKNLFGSLSRSLSAIVASRRQAEGGLCCKQPPPKHRQ